MDLEKILVKYAPSARPCGIRDRQIINEIENKTGLSEHELYKALEQIPNVNVIGGSNGIGSIEINVGFPTK